MMQSPCPSVNAVLFTVGGGRERERYMFALYKHEKCRQLVGLVLTCLERFNQGQWILKCDRMCVLSTVSNKFY